MPNFRQPRHFVIFAILAAALAMAFSGCASSPDRIWHWPGFMSGIPSNASREEQNRIVFEHVWKTTDINFYDATFGAHNWAALGEKYRPEALGAKNDDALYTVLNNMLHELGSSHAAAFSPELVRAQKKARNMDISLLGYLALKLPGLKTPVVYEVTPGGPADAAGVRRGWLQTSVMIRDDPGAPVREGEVVRQSFLDDHDIARTVTMTLRAVPVLGAQNIATLRPDGVLYLRFDRFDSNTADWLREQLKINPTKARGVVLDLRLNGGGEVRACRRMLGEFYDAPVAAGSFISRSERATPMKTKAGWPGARYTGPLVVLVARMSASAAEIFASVIQSTHRGTIACSSSTKHTAGAVLMSSDFKLPGGGLLQLPLRDYVTAPGGRLEGWGVRGDVDAPLPTVASLRAGEDLALECAVANMPAM